MAETLEPSRRGISTDIVSAFSGAPLDAIKAVAAILMVVDHINYVFIGHDANNMWYIGRPVFPLFAFVLTCNLIRGAHLPEYVARMIFLGVISQPLFSTLMDTDSGDTVFTLAVGAVLAPMLWIQRSLRQHLILLAAVLLIFGTTLRVRAGVDYGLAGLAFPGALYLVLRGKLSHSLWLAALLFALNWQADGDPWKLAPIRVTLWTAFGAASIVLASLSLRGHPRFLSNRALYIFYPGHFLVLLAIRHWI